MTAPRLVKIPKTKTGASAYCRRCWKAVRRGSTAVETTHAGQKAYVHQKCWHDLWLQPPLSVLKKQR